MGTLKDLIDKKAKDFDVVPVFTTPVDISDSWQRAKLKMSTLDVSFNSVLEKALEDNPKRVKYEKNNKMEATVIVMPKLEGHPCYLHITEKQGEGIIKVRYIIFQENGKACFIKDIF